MRLHILLSLQLIINIISTHVSRTTGLSSYGDLRISGGSNYGRLEFRQNNDTWGIVCRTGFNNNAALVACKQLGYNSGHVEYYYHGNYDSSTFAICYTNCHGGESELSDCYIEECSQYYIYCSYIVYISCDVNNTLSNSSSSSSGNDDGGSRSTNNSNGDDPGYPGIIAAVLVVLFITGIVIICIYLFIIRVVKKRKSIRQSRQTGRITIATNPQTSAHYTYTSILPQSPSYSEQQTPSIVTCEETTVDQNSAVCYAFHHDNAHTTAESTNNPSVLSDKQQLCTANSQQYKKVNSVYIIPDGSTDKQSILINGNLSVLPDDYPPTLLTGASI